MRTLLGERAPCALCFAGHRSPPPLFLCTQGRRPADYALNSPFKLLGNGLQDTGRWYAQSSSGAPPHCKHRPTPRNHRERCASPIQLQLYIISWPLPAFECVYTGQGCERQPPASCVWGEGTLFCQNSMQKTKIGRSRGGPGWVS